MENPRKTLWIIGATGCMIMSALALGLAPLAASIPGTFVLIDVPGAGKDSGQGTTPRDINENGDITGFYKDADSVLRGFVRHRDGTYATFDAPGAAKGPGLGTSPQSINSDGDVVGFYVTNPDAVRHGFVRHKNGTFTKVDPAGSLGTVVQSINSQGDITGNYVDTESAHAFLETKDGTFTPFDPPNSYNTAPQNINESGEITGYFADVNDGLHGFVRHKDGKFETFDAPDASTREGTGTYGMYINAAGEITGYYTSGAYKGLHGFIRHKDGTFTNIDPPGAIKDNAAHKDSDGYLVRPVTGPMGITEDGEITGYFGDDTGLSHGFLRHKNGTFETFDAPHASKDSSGGTLPQSINKAGDIVGYFFSDPDAVIHGFLVKRSASPASAPATKAPKKSQ
jgi:hypothetical protein